MPLNIALIFCNYGPYHVARLKAFHQYAQQYRWNVCGIELARSEVKYPWSIDPSSLPFPIYSAISDQPIETIPLLTLLSPLYQVLGQAKPDILAISGYGTPPMLAVLAWGLWHRKPCVLFSDSKEDDDARSSWRESVKGWIVRRYTSALVAGQIHKRYLLQLGMPDEAIFLGFDVVDNATFHPDVIRVSPNPIEKPYFLAINRFVPNKNLLFLIDAYAGYRQSLGDRAWDLVICGDGLLRSQLEQQIVQMGLHANIHLPGFLQQSDLLPYFAHAGCFIHSSLQEQWGLVVNEAMAAGLPVLVSNRCGCFDELVLEGINGFGFDPENRSELTRLMLKMSSDEVDRLAMGRAALKHISTFSPDFFAENLAKAVDYAIAHSTIALR